MYMKNKASNLQRQLKVRSTWSLLPKANYAYFYKTAFMFRVKIPKEEIVLGRPSLYELKIDAEAEVFESDFNVCQFYVKPKEKIPLDEMVLNIPGLFDMDPLTKKWLS